MKKILTLFAIGIASACSTTPVAETKMCTKTDTVHVQYNPHPCDNRFITSGGENPMICHDEQVLTRNIQVPCEPLNQVASSN